MRNRIKKLIKRYELVFPILLTAILLLSGCTPGNLANLLGGKQDTKLQDLEYTVVAESAQPEELAARLEEQKEKQKAEGFKLTFQDGNYLYICIGYGEKESGGYSIAVDELYLTENAIHVKTILLGPDPGTEKGQVSSYPYIVLKMENREEPVVFE
ncbi:MAG: protease complex subunit PrcB family protein [Lachnospiraceae bacterium]|nr:protease complex subunit PrcB family protein [Lachnospiraceae bacterium]